MRSGTNTVLYLWDRLYEERKPRKWLSVEFNALVAKVYFSVGGFNDLSFGKSTDYVYPCDLSFHGGNYELRRRYDQLYVNRKHQKIWRELPSKRISLIVNGREDLTGHVMNADAQKRP